MNLELAIAILTQAANYIALEGGYMLQIAAQLVSGENVDRSTVKMAEIYNVMGNQITNISLAMYCVLGQYSIDLILLQNSQTLADNTTNNSENAAIASTNMTGPQRKWSIKRIKRKRFRRWRTTQHYRP